MYNDSENHDRISPGEELLELIRDIRDELRQIKEQSERHTYQMTAIDSIRISVADAVKEVTHSVEYLEKELAAKLAPLSYLAKMLEHDSNFGKELMKLIDESAFQLTKKLDDISKSLDER